MSAVAYFGPAVVASTNPLTVRMPQATAAQPATAIGTALPALNSTVIVVVRDDGTTYVHGPPNTTAPQGQNLYLTSPNGTVYQLTVSDSMTLGAKPA